MSDPSDFVSFADYLGLNNEAGQQMLDQQMSSGEKLRTDALSASDAHLRAAQSAADGNDGGAYASTAQAAGKGLASYGDFMRGMNDPAARQALLEKTYGKGSASWLDSALVGGSGAGRIAQGQEDFKTTQQQLTQQGMRADARKGEYERGNAERLAGEQAYAAKRQADADLREKNALGMKRALEEFDLNPNNTRLPQNLSRREKEMYINQMAVNRKAQGANGSTNWDSYFAEGARRRKAAWAPHAEDRKSFGYIDFGNGPTDPSGDETWDAYYAKNRTKPGGK